MIPIMIPTDDFKDMADLREADGQRRHVELETQDEPTRMRAVGLVAASAFLLLTAACGASSSASTTTSTVPASTSPTSTMPSVTGSTGLSGASMTEVLAAVQSAQTLQAIPGNLQPALTDSTDSSYPGKKYGPTHCTGTPSSISGVATGAFGDCVYGNPAATNLVVVYGDSHAGMWAPAVQVIANSMGWKMELFSLPGCPAPDLSFISYQTQTQNTACDQFHTQAPAAIKALHPAMVVVTSESSQQVARGVYATPSQWQSGLESTFSALAQPGTTMVMIGDIPEWSLNTADCLAAHMSDVQSCASQPSAALSPNLRGEIGASSASGVHYIATQPFVCAANCEPVINNIRVYYNEYHFTATYVQYLKAALGAELGITAATPGG